MSVNQLYRNLPGKGRVKSTKYKEWIAAAEAAIHGMPRNLIVGPVFIRMEVGRPDNRRRDITNLIKCTEDFLVSHGLMEDDYLTHEFSTVWVKDIVGVRVTLKSTEAWWYMKEAAE